MEADEQLARRSESVTGVLPRRGVAKDGRGNWAAPAARLGGVRVVESQAGNAKGFQGIARAPGWFDSQLLLRRTSPTLGTSSIASRRAGTHPADLVGECLPTVRFLPPAGFR
jgi:hypothetical protein